MIGRNVSPSDGHEYINDKHNRSLDVLAFNTGDLLVAVWPRLGKQFCPNSDVDYELDRV